MYTAFFIWSETPRSRRASSRCLQVLPVRVYSSDARFWNSHDPLNLATPLFSIFCLIKQRKQENNTGRFPQKILWQENITLKSNELRMHIIHEKMAKLSHVKLQFFGIVGQKSFVAVYAVHNQQTIKRETLLPSHCSAERVLKVKKQPETQGF